MQLTEICVHQGQRSNVADSAIVGGHIQLSCYSKGCCLSKLSTGHMTLDPRGP